MNLALCRLNAGSARFHLVPIPCLLVRMIAVIARFPCLEAGSIRVDAVQFC